MYRKPHICGPLSGMSFYVLKAHDADMTKIAGQWLYHVNETNKNNKITQ